MNNNPIGVFDSGMGGLSVWQALKRGLPKESMLFLGDGLHCPYGNKSKEQIITYSTAAIQKLIDSGCKIIVVACNTATAMAIEELRATFPQIDIVGLEPAVKPAAMATKSGVIGVIATPRSFEGALYCHTSATFANKVKIIEKVGEGFVEAVENNEEGNPETRVKVEKVVKPMVEAGADYIVLGCTHYPFLLKVISEVAGEGVKIIDSGDAVCRRVKFLLQNCNNLASEENQPTYSFITFADKEYQMKLKNKVIHE